jgi:hypothetical protein
MRRRWSGPIGSLHAGNREEGWVRGERKRIGPLMGQLEGRCKVKFRARPGDRDQEGHFKNPNLDKAGL